MIEQSLVFTETNFRQALGRFATGVTIITTLGPEDIPVGLTVSSFNSVSLEPPLVLWSLSLKSSARQIFEETPHYVINVLAAKQKDLASQFSKKSLLERFNQVSWERDAQGMPILTGNAAYFECANRQRYYQGDHVIFIAEVLNCHHQTVAPLIYHAGDYDLTPEINS